MKKIWVMLLACLMFICLLSACGGASTSSTGSNSNNTNNTQSSDKKVIELNIPLGDEFTIIEADYSTKKRAGGLVTVRLKIKNNTENDFDGVSFQFYSYDKNGDRVGAHFFSEGDMEAEHATWVGDISTDLTLDDFGSIKIDYYEPEEWIDDNTMQALYKVDLDPKPEVLLEQMTEE